MVGAERKLDENALEASLAACPSCTTAEARGGHCYHAARLVHRVRLLRAMESCCERWGSIIHQLWDGSVAWHPSRIAARSLMREGGLAENTPTTEAAVEAIASHFADDLQMNPFVQRPGPTARRGQASSQLPGGAAEPAAGNARGALRRALRQALRESTYTVEAARAAAEPADLALLPRAAAAVAKAARTGVGNTWRRCPCSRKTRGWPRAGGRTPRCETLCGPG